MGVTKDMIIADVIMKEHGLAPIFTRHGLHCFGCAAANMETIEDAAKVHNIDADILIKDINEYLESHK